MCWRLLSPNGTWWFFHTVRYEGRHNVFPIYRRSVRNPLIFDCWKMGKITLKKTSWNDLTRIKSPLISRMKYFNGLFFSKCVWSTFNRAWMSFWTSDGRSDCVGFLHVATSSSPERILSRRPSVHTALLQSQRASNPFLLVLQSKHSSSANQKNFNSVENQIYFPHWILKTCSAHGPPWSPFSQFVWLCWLR